MSLSPRRLILVGLAVILLIAIPLTIYLVQKQQELRGRAAPSTTLSVMPATKTAAVGQTVSFDIVVNPGTNLVSVLTLVINYDSTKLETGASAFVKNTERPLDLIGDPVYTPGTITANLSTGIDTTNAITSQTTLATITFKALATTGSIPTEITFDQTKSLVYPLGAEENLNVLKTVNPARLTITGDSAITPTPTPTPTSTPTPTPSPIPIPTISSPTPTSAPGGGGPVNQNPVCSSLVLDRSSSGTAPYSLTFTASGTDSDGTITKVNFSFGDGTVQDITQGGGIGTNTVNAQVSHIYNTAGTFTTSATLTDNSGATSNSVTCSQTITVIAGGTGGTSPPVLATPTPTIEPSGPSETIVGIGLIGILLTIIGGVILLAL